MLESWKWLLGYGERIGYPLLVAAGSLFLLGIGHVGWGRFWSLEWWSGWGDIQRIDALLNFALPGIDAFGIDGVGGFWGISAKIVSVVFVASAATAAIRVVKRGESRAAKGDGRLPNSALTSSASPRRRAARRGAAKDRSSRG